MCCPGAAGGRQPNGVKNPRAAVAGDQMPALMDASRDVATT